MQKYSKDIVEIINTRFQDNSQLVEIIMNTYTFHAKGWTPQQTMNFFECTTKKRYHRNNHIWNFREYPFLRYRLGEVHFKGSRRSLSYFLYYSERGIFLYIDYNYYLDIYKKVANQELTYKKQLLRSQLILENNTYSESIF